jgi:hypothetical protein
MAICERCFSIENDLISALQSKHLLNKTVLNIKEAQQ